MLSPKTHGHKKSSPSRLAFRTEKNLRSLNIIVDSDDEDCGGNYLEYALTSPCNRESDDNAIKLNFTPNEIVSKLSAKEFIPSFNLNNSINNKISKNLGDSFQKAIKDTSISKNVTIINNQNKKPEPLIENDPYRDFFLLTFQSIKLNSEDFEVFQHVSIYVIYVF